MTPTPSRWSRWWAAQLGPLRQTLPSESPVLLTVVFFVGALVNLRALQGPLMTWDDSLLLSGNPRVLDSSWHGLWALWDPADAFGGAQLAYFPLRDSLFWLGWRLFENWSPPYHAAVMVLHGLVCVLVAWCGRHVSKPAWGAWLAALLFAVHPLHTESVAWVSSLKMPLSTCFLLLAMDRFLVFHNSPKGIQAAAGFLYALLGCLCKGLLLLLPGALLLVLVCVRKIAAPTALRGVSWVAGLMLLHAAALAWVAAANHLFSLPLAGAFLRHVMTAGVGAVYSLTSLVAPWNLVPVNLGGAVKSWEDSRVILSALMLVVLVLAAKRAWRNGNGLPALALCWWMGSQVIQNILGPSTTPLANTYTYVSALGPLWWLGATLAGGRPGQVWAGLITVGLCVGWTALAWERAELWTHEEALWRQAVSAPGGRDTSKGLMLLARTLLDQGARGAREEALALYQEAADKSPDAAAAQQGLAKVFFVLGDFQQARFHIQQALEHNPRDAQAWTLAAELAAQDQDLPAQARALAQVVSIHPWAASVAWNAGVTFLRAGDGAAASAQLAHAVGRRPDLCVRLGAMLAALLQADPGLARAVAAGTEGACAPPPGVGL